MFQHEPVPAESFTRDRKHCQTQKWPTNVFIAEHRQIYRFIRTLFHAAQLTAECAIITLVYIERLLNYAEIDLCPSNWRRIVLGAIMLASKVWDDQAVWNVDYCQILHDTNVDDMFASCSHSNALSLPLQEWIGTAVSRMLGVQHQRAKLYLCKIVWGAK